MGLMSPFNLFRMQLVPSTSSWWYYGCHAPTGLVNWGAIALSALVDVLPQRFQAPGIGICLAGFMLGFSLAPILAFLLSNLQLSFMTFFLTVVLGLILAICGSRNTTPGSSCRNQATTGIGSPTPRGDGRGKRPRQRYYCCGAECSNYGSLLAFYKGSSPNGDTNSTPNLSRNGDSESR